MQPKTLAATAYAPLSAERLSALALQIPMFLIAAVLAAVLIARIGAGAYPVGVAQPDAETLLETMIVSP